MHFDDTIKNETLICHCLNFKQILFAELVHCFVIRDAAVLTLGELRKTSLYCRWQTRTTQCLTPTVLHTDVDGQCDKLVTDDGHQFITLTVHLSWQHLR